VYLSGVFCGRLAVEGRKDERGDYHKVVCRR